MRLPSKSASFWLVLIGAAVLVAIVSGGDSDGGDPGDRADRGGPTAHAGDRHAGGERRGIGDHREGGGAGRDGERRGDGGAPGSQNGQQSKPRAPSIPTDARRTRVTDVADGDTIDLAGLGSSRLIGIDTPEVYFGAECFGARASAFTKRELPPGTTVYYLHGPERTDRYDRDLVYVWLPGGTFFNALLAKRGYAVPLTIAPNVEFADLFRRLAAAARAADRGLWAAWTCGGDADLPAGGG